MTIVVLAQLRAKDSASADRIAKLLSDVRDLALSPQESGTHLYSPTRAQDDPLSFTLFEEYEDEKALATHKAAKPFQVLAAEADDLFEGGLGGLKLTVHKRF